MLQLINESKLAQLTGFLEKLQEFEKISYEEFEQDKHFAVERLLELLVIYASDILLNYFSQIKEDIPTTLRTTFLRAGELKILPQDLAQRLSKAAGMRNVLVHAYSEVDLRIVYESIGSALKDFSQFVGIVSQKMNLIQTETPEPPPDEE
jgi:uncharacterized protein YutE (UPF0331/DUF86 family)